MKRADFAGKTIANFTVKELDHVKNGFAYWKCVCVCGKEKIVSTPNLKKRKTNKCTCKHKFHKGPDLSLIDKTFNELTVKSFYDIDEKRGNARFLCECSCGNKKILSAHVFTSGSTKSCGCRRNIFTRNNYEGISPTRWHLITKGAKVRNLELTITKEYIWDLFLKQNKKCALTNLDLDLRIRYNKGNQIRGDASLDRIDATKGYIPENVQWVHKDINRMKQHFDEKYFIEMCKLIAQNN